MFAWSGKDGRGLKNGVGARKAQPAMIPLDVTDMAEDGLLFFAAGGERHYANPRVKILLEGCLPENEAALIHHAETRGKNFVSQKDGNNKISSFFCLMEVNGRRLRLRMSRLSCGGAAAVVTDVTDNNASHPAPGVKPDPVGVTGAVPDEEEMEALMAQRQFQSQKLEALGQLAGGVAHDFNNLLSIVDGYTRLALKTIPPDNPAYTYLERVKQANRRGAALTKQLLTFGRHKIVSESVVDIGALLNEQEPLLRPLLNASINLVIASDESACVECAPDGIAQILMNLVINARDAMPEGGTIIIATEVLDWPDLPLTVPLDRKHDCFVRLSVTDTGIGMDAETQARIFDPFFTTKEQGRGSGLGLSMVYGIVRQSGGVIDVNSMPGEGTAMNIYFPLSGKKPVRKKIERDVAGGMRFEGYTALVAEDEPDLLFVVGNMLEDMGMKVIKAMDGNDALVKQDEYEGKIDFLLTDVVMPELNGVRLAELMRELRPETKILFMSGYPANGAMAQVRLPEDAWLLAKPVEYEKLSGVLRARLQDSGRPLADEGAIGALNRWQATSGRR